MALEWGASLREAMRWSPGEPIGARALMVAALGMAVPAGIGLALGRPDLGFTIGLGAMLLAGEAPSGPESPAERSSPLSALIPAALAVAVATLIAGAPWTDAAMIALAGIAASISGYSRPVAIGAIRFIVYLVLSVALLDSTGEHRGFAALLFGLGAVWNVVIRLLLVRRTDGTQSPPPPRQPTPAQRRAHWRRTLKALSGWQFPIRLVLGLGIAALLKHLWPTHHYGWIVLTVAILTQRPLEHLPIKTIQRSLGAVLGVGVTWIILTRVVSPGVLAVLICLLATLAQISRSRSYLVYAIVSTPVILMVIDLGKHIETSLLIDRLAATLIGAVIVVGANILLDRMVGSAEPTAKAGPKPATPRS